MNKLVTIRSNRYGLDIEFDSETEFDQLLEVLGQKFKQSGRFFKDAQMALSFSGRELTRAEEDRVLAVIRENTQIEILCIIEPNDKNEISRDHEVEIEDIPDKKVERAVAKVIQSEFSGPIPPPSIIKGYEDILPGTAERIVAMAENQAKHRQEMEKIMVNAEARDSLLGVVFAFILGVGCLVASAIIVICVPEKTGAISSAMVGITGIASIIVGFIKGTRAGSSKND